MNRSSSGDAYNIPNNKVITEITLYAGDDPLISISGKAQRVSFLRIHPKLPVFLKQQCNIYYDDSKGVLNFTMKNPKEPNVLPEVMGKNYVNNLTITSMYILCFLNSIGHVPEEVTRDVMKKILMEQNLLTDTGTVIDNFIAIADYKTTQISR